MNSAKIQELLSRRCGATFLGVFPIDRLPKPPSRRPLLLVCNTDTHDQPGEHWIALYIDMNGEYFDPLAEAPLPLFKSYLEKYCNSFVSNDKQLQSIVSHYCGHYCVYYCLMKHMGYNMEEIVDSFTRDTGLNDLIVHKFVCRGL